MFLPKAQETGKFDIRLANPEQCSDFQLAPYSVLLEEMGGQSSCFLSNCRSGGRGGRS